ncbi:unnamed protein product [Amoebophrya sp. A120]|nr:unnamed protein product [Amoebophrya sp. A120]|eukprot:GSA120T00016947001.1
MNTNCASYDRFVNIPGMEKIDVPKQCLHSAIGGVVDEHQINRSAIQQPAPFSSSLLLRFQLRLFLRVLKAVRDIMDEDGEEKSDAQEQVGEDENLLDPTATAASAPARRRNALLLSRLKYSMRLNAVRKLWQDKVSYAFEFPDFPFAHRPALTQRANRVGPPFVDFGRMHDDNDIPVDQAGEEAEDQHGKAGDLPDGVSPVQEEQAKNDDTCFSSLFLMDLNKNALRGENHKKALQSALGLHLREDDRDLSPGESGTGTENGMRMEQTTRTICGLPVSIDEIVDEATADATLQDMKPAPLDVVSYCAEDLIFTNQGLGHPLHPFPDTKVKQPLRLFCVRSLLFAAHYSNKFPFWHAAIGLAFRAEYLFRTTGAVVVEGAAGAAAARARSTATTIPAVESDKVEDDATNEDPTSSAAASAGHQGAPAADGQDESHIVWRTAVESLAAVALNQDIVSTEPQLHAVMMYRQRLDLLSRHAGNPLLNYFSSAASARSTTGALMMSLLFKNDKKMANIPAHQQQHPHQLDESLLLDLYRTQEAADMVRAVLLQTAQANGHFLLDEENKSSSFSSPDEESEVFSNTVDFAEDEKDAVIAHVIAVLVYLKLQDKNIRSGGHQRTATTRHGHDDVPAAGETDPDDEPKFYVEIGVGPGPIEHNTRALRTWHGYTGLLLDPTCDNPRLNCHPEAVFPENVLELLGDKYQVPEKFSLLSIDVDGQDYWLLKKILESKRFFPEVLIVEHGHGFWWPALQLPLDLEAVPKKHVLDELLAPASRRPAPAGSAVEDAGLKDDDAAVAPAAARRSTATFSEADLNAIFEQNRNSGDERTDPGEAVEETEDINLNDDANSNDVGVYPATAKALLKLANQHGYTLVYYGDTDLIFVREEESVVAPKQEELQGRETTSVDAVEHQNINVVPYYQTVFPNANDLPALCNRYRQSERAWKRDLRYSESSYCFETAVQGISRRSFREKYVKPA